MRVFVRHARGESRQGNGKLMMMTRREIKEYQRERSRTTTDNAQDKYVGNGEWWGDEGGATGRQQISLSTNANVEAHFCERCLLPMIRSMLTRFLEPD